MSHNLSLTRLENSEFALETEIEGERDDMNNMRFSLLESNDYGQNPTKKSHRKQCNLSYQLPSAKT